MAQISNSNSLVAVKVLSKKGLHLTCEVQVWGNRLKHFIFISRPLTFEPQHRLGCSETSEVMEHPWLFHVDWISMRYRTYEVSPEPT